MFILFTFVYLLTTTIELILSKNQYFIGLAIAESFIVASYLYIRFEDRSLIGGVITTMLLGVFRGFGLFLDFTILIAFLLLYETFFKEEGKIDKFIIGGVMITLISVFKTILISIIFLSTRIDIVSIIVNVIISLLVFSISYYLLGRYVKEADSYR